jgi:hypothetical protein
MSIEPASAPYLNAMQHWQTGTPQSGPASQASGCQVRTSTATGRFAHWLRDAWRRFEMPAAAIRTECALLHATPASEISSEEPNLIVRY